MSDNQLFWSGMLTVGVIDLARDTHRAFNTQERFSTLEATNNTILEALCVIERVGRTNGDDGSPITERFVRYTNKSKNLTYCDFHFR